MGGRRTATLLAALLAGLASEPLRADDVPAAPFPASPPAEGPPQSGTPQPLPTPQSATQPASQTATPAGGRPGTAVPASDADGFHRTGDGLLEFHARNLDVAEAFAQLRRLMRKNLVVAPDVRARFTGDLYGVTLQQAVDAICRSADLMAREENGFVYVEQAAVQSRMFRLSYARATDVLPLLQPLTSPKGKLTATGSAQQGIKASQDQSGGDDYAAAETIIAVDLAHNLDAMEAALRVLDARPLQILMEATLVAATLNDATSLGVEVKALAGIDFRELGGLSDGLSGVGTGNLPARQLDELTAGLATNLNASLPKGGLSLGILKDDVGVFVRALQQVTDVNVMANPKVMVLNKQRGEVIVGRRDGYLTTTTTQTSTDQKVEFLETGTRLLFRPFIGEDGMVRLEIHPEDSNGGVTTAGLPFKETVEVTTNILVPSGQTVVIGGLFRERTVSMISKVPLLGDIPLLGAAFRSSSDETVRQEILILLTPRIVTPMPDGLAAAAARDPMTLGASGAAADGGIVVVDPDVERRASARLAETSARLAEERTAAQAALDSERAAAQTKLDAERIAAQAKLDAERNAAQERLDAERAESKALLDEERARSLAVLEAIRAETKAARESAERLLEKAEAARVATAAQAAKAQEAAKAAASAKDEQRRRADEAAAAAIAAAAEQARKATESADADRAAAEAEARLAAAAEAAKAARDARTAKSAESAAAAKRAEQAKAEHASRAEDADRAAKAAEEARQAAEAAEAAKNQQEPRTPAEK